VEIFQWLNFIGRGFKLISFVIRRVCAAGAVAAVLI